MSKTRELFDRCVSEVRRVIVGQDEPLTLMLAAVMTEGHVLIEGVPGLAKTLMVRTLARTLDVGFSRIQFTPDLMPADVIGTHVYDAGAGAFRFHRGPIFTQFLLADEINRAPAKTQSAMLQVMQERQISADGQNYPMPGFFSVFATQNPLESEGVYPLPEAQLDRFMFKVVVDYPKPNEEIEVLLRHHANPNEVDFQGMGVKAVVDEAGLRAAQEEIRATSVRPEVAGYIVELARATRGHPHLAAGASPRAGLMALAGAKAAARLEDRDFVIPDDVKRVLKPCFRHRIWTTPGAEVQGVRADDVIEEVLRAVKVPR
jgi:MoxR-like ATPase